MIGKLIRVAGGLPYDDLLRLVYDMAMYMISSGLANEDDYETAHICYRKLAQLQDSRAYPKAA